MISLIFIFFIGKWFYDLAKKYGKSEWPYTLLGIISLFCSTFIFGVLLTVVIELLGIMPIDDMNEAALGLISILLGLFGSWLYHTYLEKSWKKELEKVDPDILDDLL